MSKRFGHRRISATERLFRKLPDLAKLRQIAYSTLVLAIILWAISFQGLVLRVWARDWPQTSAVGLEATLVSVSSTRGVRGHELRLRYRYVVDGRTYEGSTFRWLGQRIHPDSFDRYQRQYGAGTRFFGLL